MGRALQFLFMLIMMRVATTILSTEQLGRVSLVLTTTAFFALFLVNPVGMFINRRLHAWRAEGKIKLYLVNYVIYLIIIATIAAGVLLLISLTDQVDFGISIGWLLILVCGSLIFNTINQTSIPSLNLLGYSKEFVILSLLTIIASFIFALLAIKFFDISALNWMIGLLLGQVILAFIGTKVLFNKLKPSMRVLTTKFINRKHVKTLIDFSWPISLAAGFWWIQSQGYRYLIEGYLGFSQLGLFVAGYGISAGMIIGFESVLTTYFQPQLYKDANTTNPLNQIYAWKAYAAAIIPALLLTFIMIIILAPELTFLFLGAEFQSASRFVVWGALAETARVISSTYSLIAHVRMKTRWLIIPNLFGAIASIVLCTIFIPIYGAVGVGLALVLSGLGVLILMYILIARPIIKEISISIFPVIWYSLGLCSCVALTHHLLDPLDQYKNLILLAIVGVIYLGFLWILLKKHIQVNELRLKI